MMPATMSGTRPTAASGSPTAASPGAVPKRGRRRHTPGGVRLGQQASREAQKMAAAILEVLAGARTPQQAAEALGVSLPRYFQLETRSMQALVQSCEPRPRGRGHGEREVATLRRHNERLQRELVRQQTLVRMAQRTIGLSPPAPPKPSSGKKRRRRPVVRALAAAAYLRQQSQEAPAAASPPEVGDPRE